MSDTRYITPADFARALPDPTPVEDDIQDPERFRLYRLCPCGECAGRGKMPSTEPGNQNIEVKCKSCRGEGRSLALVATCGSPEAVGVALVTLGREGEWQDCQLGVLDSAGAKNEKWLVVPWQASARNVRDAARTLAHARHSS